MTQIDPDKAQGIPDMAQVIPSMAQEVACTAQVVAGSICRHKWLQKWKKLFKV
jgi:hypothetical protein